MRTLTCPRCRGKWQLEQLHAGMKAVCPHCRASMTIAAGHGPQKDVPQKTATTVGEASSQPRAESKAESVVLKPDQAMPSAAPVAVAPRLESVEAEASGREAKTGEAATSPPWSTSVQSWASGKLQLMIGILILAVGAGLALWRPWQQPAGNESSTSIPSPTSDNVAWDDTTPPELPPAQPSATEPGNETPGNIEPPTDTAIAAAPQETDDRSSLPVVAATPTTTAPPKATTRPASANAAPVVAPPKPVAAPTIAAATPSIKPIPSATTAAALPKPTASAAPPRVSKSVAAPAYDRAPLPAGTEGTEAVTSKTKLKIGDRIHANFEGHWYAVTVVDVLADGNVRIRWETWGPNVVGNIAREKLRLPEKK